MKQNAVIKQLSKYMILFLCAMALWVIFGNQTARAENEKVSFGSETYEWEIGESNPIGIYTTSDSTIDSFYYVVTYDPQVLEYVSGGVVLSDNEIEVRVNDVDDTRYVLYLYFQPITAEPTSIEIKDIRVKRSDGTEVNPDPVSVGVNGPAGKEGLLEDIKINGTSIPGFRSDKWEYSIYAKADDEKAEIETAPADADVEISDTELKEGNNEITLTCTSENGYQEVYTLKIYRPAERIADRTGDTAGALAEDEDHEGLILNMTPTRFLWFVLICVLTVIFLILLNLKFVIMKRRKRKKDGERTDKLLDDPEFDMDFGADFFDGDEPGDDGECEIRVRNVTMDFKREKDESSSVKELIIQTLKGQRTIEKFRALDNISFSVKKGEVVGVIGTNGSGKSTILKIISGALIPTGGSVEVDKRKIQLLTLGTGFDQELTGRENVYLNGAIIGYTKEYIDEKFDEIVKFAELEGFMDERVKNYSSGMVSRLGFAIATIRETPEILILDEVLSVGDIFFRKKSEARIQEMIHGGSTVLIVSHSTAVIRKNCTKVVWIERGRLRAIGDPKTVCDAYEKMNQ